jgi:uncharacterized repeat protein (TIGR03803 family)
MMVLIRPITRGTGGIKREGPLFETKSTKPAIVPLHGVLRAVCVMAAVAGLQAQTPTETVLLSFSDFPNGANPYAPLARAPEGNLYGTTNQGGAADLGVVFMLTRTGTMKVLHSFQGGNDGANPYSGVALDSAGNLYGTTYGGGAGNAGVVYKLDTSGHESVLYSFTGGADGANPYGGVVLDSSGNLYGTTYNGGASRAGVVYKVSPAGQETVLYAFTGGTDGGNPYAGVVFDSSGNLYGTAVHGGSAGYYAAGVVYKVSTKGQETVLHSFSFSNTLACYPYGGVVFDSAGNLYGTASAGGEWSGGAVYKLDTARNYTVLFNLATLKGPSRPEAGLVLDSDEISTAPRSSPATERGRARYSSWTRRATWRRSIHFRGLPARRVYRTALAGVWLSTRPATSTAPPPTAA